MASRIGSSQVSSSGEYVTNWWSVAASLAVAAFVAVFWTMGAPEPRDTRNSAGEPRAAPAATRPVAAPAADKATARDEARAAANSIVAPATVSNALHASFVAAIDSAKIVYAVRLGAARHAIAAIERAAITPAPVAKESGGVPARQLIASDVALYEYLSREVPEISLGVQANDVRVLPSEQPITSVNTTSDEEMIAQMLTRRTASEVDHPHLAMLERLTHERAELAGLPLRDASGCFTPRETSQKNQILALALRRDAGFGSREVHGASLWHPLCETSGGAPKVEKAAAYVTQRIGLRHRSGFDLTSPNCASVLEQVLQVERYEDRLALIDLLGKISGPEASVALARRAVFDIDISIRLAATAALSGRPVEEFLPTLRAAKLHPLAPAKVHAQQALAKLDGETLLAGRQASESFASHISSPYRHAGDQWVVNELVKVNHLRNCLMCHPKSFDSADVLRAQMPIPGQRLPEVYYNRSQGDFVRADIVYLKPDFSLPLAVEKAEPWPTMQRFDFFVRTRAATPGEMLSVRSDGENRRTALALQAVAAVCDAVRHVHDEARWLVADLSASRL